ncbi:hypothetical protein [Azospirillum sp. B4]|uniref:hypothetical protein n=1 Tax=Azospirillum sp. B4 TaxID=95605 RepID=UPI000346A423|nr:hypothetical protein [Azospirillum sp. B4]
MTPDEKEARIATLLHDFRTQVLRYYEADLLDNHDVMKSCLPKMGKAVRALDPVEPDGRIALAPLLDDPDDGVRVYAAAYLFGRLPDRAQAVWRDVQLNSDHPTAYRSVIRFQIIAESKPEDFIKAFE